MLAIPYVQQMASSEWIGGPSDSVKGRHHHPMIHESAGHAVDSYEGTRSSTKKPARRDQERLRAEKPTSMRLFKRFLTTMPEGTVDASKINSRECFEAWVTSRKTAPAEPEKSFHRTLSSHLTGVDGRVPFKEAEEMAILALLRRRERWPCFANTEARFGEFGFKGFGFHERQARESGEPNRGEGHLPSRASARKTKRPSASKDETDTTSDSEDQTATATSKTRHRTGPASTKGSRRKRTKHAASDDDEAASEISSRESTEEPTSSLLVHQGILSPSHDELHYEGTDPETLKSLMDQLVDPPTVVQPSSFPPMSSSSSRSFPNTPVYAQPDVRYMIQATQAAHFARDPSPGARFLSMAHSVFGNLSSLGWDGWKKLLGIARMVLIGTGFFHTATLEEVRALVNRFEALYPRDGIVVLDLTCADARDRIIAQNQLSRHYVGSITRYDGGFAGRLFYAQDAWHVLTAALQAFRGKGTEVRIQCGIVCFDQSILPFDGCLYVDPQTKLLLLHGHPIVAPGAPN